MSLELWLEDQNLSQASGTPITVQLGDGMIAIVTSSTYTVVDFLGTVVSAGALSVSEDIAIDTLIGVIPTSSGGFTLIFGGDFSALPTMYSVELDSGFQQAAPVVTVFDDFGGSADARLLSDGRTAILHDTFDNGARTTSLTIVAADGAIESPVQANTNVNASSLFHQIAGNGSVLFGTWLDADAGILRGRVFDSDGNTIGDAFDVSTGAGNDNRVHIDVLSNGNFVVTWTRFDDNFENAEVFARLFDASGSALGDQFSITPSSAFDQFASDVIALDEGGFLFAWEELDRGSSQGTSVALYDNNGTISGDPLTLDGIAGSRATIGSFADGRFLVADASTFTSYQIIDSRMGNFDGDERDNLLVGSLTAPSTINGFGGDDQFFGTRQDETFNGGEGNDILNGGEGDDILDGGAGDDTVNGGNGNDQITTGDGRDVVDAGAGDDVITVEFPEFTFIDPTNPIIQTIDGGEGQDTLAFTSGRSSFDASGVSGIETLLVDSTDDFALPEISNLSGLEEIIIQGGPGNARLFDSDNPDAALLLSTPVGDNFRGFLELANSNVANINGSNGAESVIVRDGSFVGGVNLGGGDDFFQFSAGSSLANAVTSLNGGAGGDDTLAYLSPTGPINESLANVSGFELLGLGPSGPTERQSYTFSDVSGFAFVISSSVLIGTNTPPQISASDVTFTSGGSSDLSSTILGGAQGGSYTIGSGLTVHSYVYYGDADERPEDDPERFALLGTTIINQGAILNEVDFDNGDDLYDGRDGTVGGPVTGGAGIDTLLGGSGAESFFGGLDADILNGGGGNDTLDGGSNIDRAIFAGNAADYTITQTTTGVFRVVGADGTDTLTTIEFADFDDQSVRLLSGSGVSVNFETADPTVYANAVTALRDFDGNDLGGDGAWLRIGSADVNGDGDVDQILVNDAIGRFATVGTAEDGLVYFDDHSWAGETRIAGIYIDPFVANGSVEQGSPFDSQARFQNDLRIENINRVLGSNDYNNDGIWEVYLALTDGTAFLQALMHADGNIRFANYQSEEQVREYLEANGFGEETFGDWFGGSGESAQGALSQSLDAMALFAPTPSATMWSGVHFELSAEHFG